MTAIKPGISAPVYVAGIKYPSLFNASEKTAISGLSFYKGFKRSGGGPCKIKKNIVALETWVIRQIENIGGGYAYGQP